MTVDAPSVGPAGVLTLDILAVDDDPQLLGLLADQLRGLGHRLTLAKNGAAALKACEGQALDLVLLDLHLPDLDGEEVLRRLRQARPELAVAIVTGCGELDTVLRCLRLGICDFLEKPVTPGRLGELVGKVAAQVRGDEREALARVAQDLLDAHELDATTRRICEHARALMRADEVSLLLRGGDGKLHIVQGDHLDDEVRAATALALGEAVAGRAAQDRRAYLLDGDAANDPRFAGLPRRGHIRSAIVMPLLDGETVVGVLNLNRLNGQDAFSHPDVRRAQLLAALAASAVVAAQRRRELAEARAQGVQTEKLAALGKLVAGVAHEINNPLTVIMGYANLLQGEIAPGPAREDLAAIARETERCRQIVRNLLAFARQRTPQFARLNLAELGRKVLDERRAPLARSGIQVEEDWSPTPEVFADRAALEQVIANLMANAQDAIGRRAGAGRMRLSTRASESEVLLTVEDDGPGIPEELQGRVFEPFFTTKEVGQGTGLGLSHAFGVLESHGGRIFLESESGRGTRFHFALPRQFVPVAAPGHAAPVAARPREHLRFLIVDDEPPIAEFLRRFLSLAGHQVGIETDASRGLERCREAEFDVILCDLSLPGLDGLAFHEALLRERPVLAERLIFITGHARHAAYEEHARQHGRTILHKPFTGEELLGVVNRLGSDS